MPRNWNLEGSEDGIIWNILSTHHLDQSFSAAENIIFPVNEKGYYRYIRLKNTGPDSTNTNYLGISGFELFGSVKRK